MASLRHITPINYNEGSNDDDDEKEDIEEEGGVAYQYNTDIPTVSSYARKSSITLKRHSSPEPSPSSLRNPHQKGQLNLTVQQRHKGRERFWT